MKQLHCIFVSAVAVLLFSVACNNGVGLKVGEVGVEEGRPDDYDEWDEMFADSTGCYMLMVKKECDTVIQFDYMVGENSAQRRSISGMAVNKYGWLGCEFIECAEGTLTPADEYWWEDSISLGIRIGMNDAHQAEVQSDNERWNSPLLYRVK